MGRILEQVRLALARALVGGVEGQGGEARAGQAHRPLRDPDAEDE